MEKFIPSYNEYKKILKDILKTKKLKNFKDARTSEEFIVLRHDIEFSIDRAYKMSLIETELGICSNYFVQITNNSYNALSKKNILMLKEMIKNGHTVGLHYHMNGETDFNKMKERVKFEINVLSKALDTNINIFSIHRPSKAVLAYNLELDGIINTYDTPYFTFNENVTAETKIDVKYIADSKHRWNYGYPNYETFMNNKKIQLLVHPYSWTEKGYDSLGTFDSLLNEKKDEMIETFNGECYHFAEIYDDMKKGWKHEL